METICPGVQMPPIATSMMASLYGSISTWDRSLTLTDLFGYSGHAFILNIERALCPSGPTAWDWGAILFPLRQMYSLKRVCATCDVRSAEEARELIWQRTMDSIGEGRPVVLWDVMLPEFYLAHGYDEATGDYLMQGPGADTRDGRACWSNLGLHTGQVWALFPGPHGESNRDAARTLALRGAVSWHRWPNELGAQWTFGGEAWDVWIAAMREEELAHDSRALSLNQLVYHECRQHAAAFLESQGSAYAEAAAAYRQVADSLHAVCEAWPYPAPAPPVKVRQGLAEHLVAARDAEAEGIRMLSEILHAQRSVPV